MNNFSGFKLAFVALPFVLTALLSGCAASGHPAAVPDAIVLPTPTVQVEASPAPWTPEAPIALDTEPKEVTPLLLTLSGPVAQRGAEVSGMAWMSDTLVLLPQYPYFDGGESVLYGIPKGEILEAIAGTLDSIEPIALPIALNGVQDQIAGFEGFESIVFAGDEFWLTSEATSGRTGGWLARGNVVDGGVSLAVDPTSLQWIEPQTGIRNYSDESIVLTPDGLFTLYEANGAGVNGAPVAHRFGREGTPMGVIPFPNIEYRVTDATSLDGESRFWVINYFFPGDTWLEPATDPIADAWGEGASHTEMEQVERLVEMQYTPAGVSVVDQAPIQLKLTLLSRNWEGIERLDDLGFLLVTDQFPDTLLAFVPVE